MSLLKTSSILEKTDLELSLETFPVSGILSNGQFLPQKPLVILTRGNDCSLFPTPVASDSMNILGKNDTYTLTKNGRVRRHTLKGKDASLNLSRFVKFYPVGPLKSSCVPKPVKNPLSPVFVELLMGLPAGWTRVKENSELSSWEML